MDDVAVARRALPLLDLTELSDACSEAAVEKLLANATGKHGKVSAVCVWPQFVKRARQRLDRSGVKVATVVNFPSGDGAVEQIADDVAECVNDGADEIDLVLPYKAFLAGDEKRARQMVEAIDQTLDDGLILKVILETGEYPDQASIARASRLAIEAGADFIKTSTGKTKISATPDAARTMLDAIKASGRDVGLKPSGGIRTVADAASYLSLADAVMGPDWVRPSRFRFGASGLLTAINAAIEGTGGELLRSSY
ncbi:MAG: deoxyribose-phosphate aldolase [Rhizobiales bacterium 65-9]|nr:deoxyribose-phosphate aldolase [Hyphomicrobiales bacterium]OJY37351.1 MAG: deoxyribose-phosphate aldolase [Rhizobiales bacterium 65-9]